MKKGLILIFLVIISFVSAQSDVFTSSSLVSDIKISGSIEIGPLGENYKIKKVTVDNTLFPKEEWNQEIIDFDAEPDYSRNESAIRFEWKEPEEEYLEFKVSSRVKTINSFVKVREKIPFPLLNLPYELEKYIVSRENIDSDDNEIIEMASEIVKGEDDFYTAVFRIADWVEENINYSLDTLTMGVSQKASWVLKNRYGVCDELTSLFVAMLRGIGIPARYISGVAYTNRNDVNRFGSHAWAEVYFPGTGWVPFDVTYGEFGFIDASHIKLKESLDSNEASANYKWEGWMVDLKTSELDIDTETISVGKKLEPLLEISASVLKEGVKFGSHNLIEVLVKNPNDFYVPTEVFISKSEGLVLFDDHRKQLLLRPNEEKIIYWIVKVDDGLNEDYTYTFRIMTYTTRNASSETWFNSSTIEPYFNLKGIENILEQRSEEESKTYSRKVEMSCTPEKQSYYIYERPKVDCVIVNNGNTYLRDLDVCVGKNCHGFNLGIAQRKEITLMLNFSSFGKKDIEIMASNNYVSKSDNVETEILDVPEIEIRDINYPENISYGKKFTIYFTLNKVSVSNPKNLVVELDHDGSSKTWDIPELKQDRRFIINLDTRNLRAGENIFKIIAKYSDGNERDYRKEDSITISLENISVLQKSFLFLSRVARSMAGFDFKILILAAFVFGIVLGFVFKGSKRKH